MRRWVFNELDVLNPFPQTSQTCGFSPVCVRICLRRRDGLSNAFPQTSQGRRVLSRPFFTIMCRGASIVTVSSVVAPSLETDRLSSGSDGGVMSTRGSCGVRGDDGDDVDTSNDWDRSRGVSSRIMPMALRYCANERSLATTRVRGAWSPTSSSGSS